MAAAATRRTVAHTTANARHRVLVGKNRTIQPPSRSRIDLGSGLGREAVADTSGTRRRSSDWIHATDWISSGRGAADKNCRAKASSVWQRTQTARWARVSASVSDSVARSAMPAMTSSERHSPVPPSASFRICFSIKRESATTSSYGLKLPIAGLPAFDGARQLPPGTHDVSLRAARVFQVKQFRYSFERKILAIVQGHNPTLHLRQRAAQPVPQRSGQVLLLQLRIGARGAIDQPRQK